MGLTTGCDFDKESDKRKADGYVEKNEPLLVIGSPTCTPYSKPQSLNPDIPESRREWEVGVNHMRFVF